MHVYLLLYIEFFKIGLFALGGGYATLPFLYHLTSIYNWFSTKELTEMIAVSNITPGPIGINMATFAGFKTAGIMGSTIATLAIVTPGFIIVLVISKILDKFKHSEIMQGLMLGLRPAACAMISAVGIKLFASNILNLNKICCSDILKGINIDYRGLLLLVLFVVFSIKLKRNPIIYIVLGLFFGIVLNIKTI